MDSRIKLFKFPAALAGRNIPSVSPMPISSVSLTITELSRYI